MRGFAPIDAVKKVVEKAKNVVKLKPRKKKSKK